jgi:hypothetical protein
MTTKQCKECDQEFELNHAAQKYCTKECSEIARRKYVRNKVQMHRINKNKWTFLHNENTENESDQIMVTYLKSPKIFDELSSLDEVSNIIGIQINESKPDEIGIVIAKESSSEEE